MPQKPTGKICIAKSSNMFIHIWPNGNTHAVISFCSPDRYNIVLK